MIYAIVCGVALFVLLALVATLFSFVLSLQRADVKRKEEIENLSDRIIILEDIAGRHIPELLGFEMCWKNPYLCEWSKVEPGPCKSTEYVSTYKDGVITKELREVKKCN